SDLAGSIHERCRSGYGKTRVRCSKSPFDQDSERPDITKIESCRNERGKVLRELHRRHLTATPVLMASKAISEVGIVSIDPSAGYSRALFFESISAGACADGCRSRLGVFAMKIAKAHKRRGHTLTGGYTPPLAASAPNLLRQGSDHVFQKLVFDLFTIA